MRRKKFLAALTLLFFAAMAVFTQISEYIAVSALTGVKTKLIFESDEVSAACITEEGDRAFVHEVMTEPSILGEQYVVKDRKVEIVEKKDKRVVINIGDRPCELIVESEREVYDGEKVRKE